MKGDVAHACRKYGSTNASAEEPMAGTLARHCMMSLLSKLPGIVQIRSNVCHCQKSMGVVSKQHALCTGDRPSCLHHDVAHRQSIALCSRAFMHACMYTRMQTRGLFKSQMSIKEPMPPEACKTHGQMFISPFMVKTAKDLLNHLLSLSTSALSSPAEPKQASDY